MQASSEMVKRAPAGMSELGVRGTRTPILRRSVNTISTGQQIIPTTFTACPSHGFLDLPTVLAGIQEKKPFSQVGGYNFSSQKLKGIDNTVESFTDVWQLNYSGCGVLIWNRRISSSIIEYKTWNRMLVLYTTNVLGLIFDNWL